MSRAKVTGIVFVVCGVTIGGLAAGTGWLRHAPRTEQPLAARQRQDDLRNAARVVELAARAAAEPAPPREPAPVSTDAAQGEPERAARKNGEVRWRVNAPPSADARAEGTALCGGEVCAAGQFCCGPPECGHCANRLTGPRCPATCP
jgi:hypothetical protein